MFLGLSWHGPDQKLAEIKLDSRQVKPGDLFLAVPGAKFNGRDYITQALENGAAVILVDDPEYKVELPIIQVPNLQLIVAELAAFFYQWPSEQMDIIGITGTNGKTSISHYLAQIFKANRINCGIMGTLGNGQYGRLSKSNLTTSDSCTVQRQLAEFLRQHTKYVAMEVSSHALQQRRLDFVKFSTAVFTNLTQDHLDYHGTMDQYFAAKALLFADFYPERRVINLDSPYGMQLLNTYSGLCYSIYDPTADIYTEHNKIYTPWGTGILMNPLLGDFNLSNILACIAVCGLYGLDFDLILQGVKNLQSVPGRMQKLSYDGGPQVIVDYAHTPDALENALQALHFYSSGEIYCIFGCGGDRDPGKRPLMLSAALDNSDYVVITQDNPRTEEPDKIVADILSLTADRRSINVIQDRRQAIQDTIRRAKPEDVILIAGKGHENVQIIGNDEHPFSDAEVALEVLNNIGENVCPN